MKGVFVSGKSPFGHPVMSRLAPTKDNTARNKHTRHSVLKIFEIGVVIIQEESFYSPRSTVHTSLQRIFNQSIIQAVESTYPKHFAS